MDRSFGKRIVSSEATEGSKKVQNDFLVGIFRESSDKLEVGEYLILDPPTFAIYGVGLICFS